MCVGGGGGQVKFYPDRSRGGGGANFLLVTLKVVGHNRF